MFKTQNEFDTWLASQFERERSGLFGRLSADTRQKLYNLHQIGSDLDGHYELEPVLLKLGGMLHQFMQLANELDWVGSDKKEFVMVNAIALSRLIDNGPDGTEDRINKNIPGFEFLTDEPDSLQEKFIRPQASLAIEDAYRLSKQANQQQQELREMLRQAQESM